MEHITTKGFIILQFLQKLSSQKSFWDKARLSSLYNKWFVAGLFYKHLCDLFFGKVVKPVSRGSVINGPTPSNQLTNSAFFSKPSKHHYIRTVRPRGLTFWENVHPQIYIYVLIVCNFFICGQSGGDIHPRICYQWGLPPSSILSAWYDLTRLAFVNLVLERK